MSAFSANVAPFYPGQQHQAMYPTPVQHQQYQFPGHHSFPHHQLSQPYNGGNMIPNMHSAPMMPQHHMQQHMGHPPQGSVPPPQQMYQSQQQAGGPDEVATVHKYILQLLDVETREAAVAELSKMREKHKDLGVWLWYSVGSIAVLLQEIISVYSLLSPPTLQTAASNRVSNSLALLQCIASHEVTRKLFLQSQMAMFLYPFLGTTSTAKPFEYLRLTSLGVIGALVKSDDTEVIGYLLTTEIVPLCLKIMENGTELSKTVATFVVQKILHADEGLNYMCQSPERFTAVATVLRNVVREKQDCTARLLRLVVRCYLRLTEHEKAKNALKQCLPDELRDSTYTDVIEKDPSLKKSVSQLLAALGDPGIQQQR
eukprot:Tbor_TRINITY_DN5796_c0_g1::TRINITY_DN5796_c0_g1_i1::g.20395::m.20395/K12606/RCD1, CNOT9, CAF40; CCR4-NOT transcription complex subunit 9